MKWSDLIASLKICRGAGIEVIGPEGKVEVKSSIFPVVALVNRAEWEQNPKRCGVTYSSIRWSPIASTSSPSGNSTMPRTCRLKNHLARWMFKHLSHHYIQADWNIPYTIMQSTIVGQQLSGQQCPQARPGALYLRGAR